MVMAIKQSNPGKEKEEAVLLLLADSGLGPSSSASSPPPPPPPPSSSSSSSTFYLCRICHEEEEESSASMEAPCACSGTLKFAHRGCVQRWCDEKGSTTCEICLQNFEPGYIVPVKKALVEIGVTIRGSLEVPRQNYVPRSPDEEEEDDAGYAECSPASERSASCCQSVAVTLTVVLLLRHLVSVITVGADHYAFTLLTVFVLRASGILLPFYVIMSALRGIREVQRLQQLHVTVAGQGALRHHVIQIEPSTP